MANCKTKEARIGASYYSCPIVYCLKQGDVFPVYKKTHLLDILGLSEKKFRDMMPVLKIEKYKFVRGYYVGPTLDIMISNLNKYMEKHNG